MIKLRCMSVLFYLSHSLCTEGSPARLLEEKKQRVHGTAFLRGSFIEVEKPTLNWAFLYAVSWDFQGNWRDKHNREE